MADLNIKVEYTQLFINNKFVDSVSGKTFESVNPATLEVVANIAEGDKADVDLAVDAAENAFKRGSVWRNLDASARGKLLQKLADLVERDASTLAYLETIENGKPFSYCLVGVKSAAGILRYNAGWSDKTHGKTIPADGPFFTYTRKEPVGVVGQITPWNAPVRSIAFKWGPALAAGCTIVLKPAEQTPLNALYMAALSREAGFPDGVINIVTGYGPTAGHAISSHMKIRKVAFTGSVEVGRLVMEAAAKSNLKKVSLELGGKSPLVIFNDADLNEAAEIAQWAIFANSGQICCSGSRTFVQSKIYDDFVKRAKDLASARRVGDPFDENVIQGPQADADTYNKVLSYINSGVKEGAKLETGGKKFGSKGYFIEPTVFSNVTDNMQIAKEEIFGPVQSIIKFDTLEEVIERSNKTTYGLAAGIVTKDINVALTFANAVEAGIVWVNSFLVLGAHAPFGGYKESGLGRELGEEGVELYFETKTVAIKLPSKQ